MCLLMFVHLCYSLSEAVKQIEAGTCANCGPPLDMVLIGIPYFLCT